MHDYNKKSLKDKNALWNIIVIFFKKLNIKIDFLWGEFILEWSSCFFNCNSWKMLVISVLKKQYFFSAGYHLLGFFCYFIILKLFTYLLPVWTYIINWIHFIHFSFISAIICHIWLWSIVLVFLSSGQVQIMKKYRILV